MIHLNWWKGRTYNLLSKALLEIWQETKSFTDKQKLREFSTTRPALQQILKELLQVEKKRPWLEAELRMGKLTGKDRHTVKVGNHLQQIWYQNQQLWGELKWKILEMHQKKTITGQYHWCEHRCKNPQQNISNNTLKGSYTMIKWGLSQGCKDFLISANQSVIYHTHKLKNKTHMIISIDAGKAADKIQHPFTIKKLSRK